MKSLLTAFIVAVTVCTIMAAPTRSRPDVSTIEGQAQYLKEFGYLEEYDQISRSGVPTPDFSDAIQKFQSFTGLKVTGEVDDATIAMMNTPRCGAADSRHDARYGWGHRDLTYRIDIYPDSRHGLSDEEVDQAIANAFKLWTDKANITLTPKDSGIVDIEIIFGSGDHGDGYPFDGPYGVLAHAYFPHTGPVAVDHVSGDAHFDDDEAWRIIRGSGINLPIVALHEFGHSLGLGHSSIKDAIMYPYLGNQPFELHTDDIAGIQFLYGNAETTTTTTTEATTTETPETTTTSAPQCENGFSEMSGTRKMGGDYKSSKSTMWKCRNHCKDKAHCWGFTFRANAVASQRCMVHQLDIKSKPEYNFYQKEFTGDTYKTYEGKSHGSGRKYTDYLTKDDCQIMCDADERCIGYTFPISYTEGQKVTCRLQINHFLPTGDDSDSHFTKC